MKSLQIFSLVVICSILFVNCSSNEVVIDVNEIPEITDALPFIAPPFDDVNVEFTSYTFNAEEGSTIFHESGSILVFPANSMLDVSGKLVTGQVDIAYREFSSPVDFFLSGIQMNYDSAGVDYMFESSAMCEVNASQGGQELFVNPESQPEVNLTTKNFDQEQNLYFLDEETKCWQNKGKDVITKVADLNLYSDQAPTATANEVPEAPVKPKKPRGDLPTFNLAVDPASVPELSAYDNLVFEVHEDDKVYKESDGDELWEDVQMKPGRKSGTYLVTFSNSKRKVTYLTRPVFTGKDYDEAVLAFEKKQAEYDVLLKTRVDNEVKEATKAQSEFDEIQKLNSLVIQRNIAINERIKFQNEIMIRYNDSVNALNEITEARNVITREDNKKMAERIKRYEDAVDDSNLDEEVIRSFAVAKFGVWNCDQPILQKAINFAATFTGLDGKIIELNKITVVYKGYNGLRSFYSSTIQTLPSAPNMIWAVKDKKFVYLSYSEYSKCDIDRATSEYAFKMNVHPEEITSAEDIRNIIGL
jgi:hypothetical protein